MAVLWESPGKRDQPAAVNCGRCGDAKAAAQAEKVAVGSLESGVSDLRSAYYGVSTLAVLGRTAPAKALDSALQLLQKLKASKGRLRDSPKGAASLTATAHGYLIAAAAQKVGSIGSQHLSAVETLLSGISQVCTSTHQSSRADLTQSRWAVIPGELFMRKIGRAKGILHRMSLQGHWRQGHMSIYGDMYMEPRFAYCYPDHTAGVHRHPHLHPSKGSSNERPWASCQTVLQCTWLGGQLLKQHMIRR